MKRRRLVALVSVAVLFALGIAAVSVLLIATRTDFGHEQLRKRLVEPLVAGGVHGSVHIGRLGGNLLDSVTFDTLAIRDTTGALFVVGIPVRLVLERDDVEADRADRLVEVGGVGGVLVGAQRAVDRV